MSNNTTMSIVESLKIGATIANRQAARVSEKSVSIDDFSRWMAAEKRAYDAFYDYACETRKVAVAHTRGEEYTMSDAIRNAAFDALRTIFAVIGNVNGAPLRPNNEVMAILANTSVKEDTSLIGEAFKQASIVRNLKQEVDAFAAGMNVEYMNAKRLEYGAACEKLRLLKKQENSCDRRKVRATFGAFRSALELELSAIIAKQEVTPRATLEAREAALKAERAEKRKANKQAKKAQAKSTAPNTLPNMDEISVGAIK